MASIIERDGKKVIELTESETLNGTHLSNVITALGAFADSKSVVNINQTRTTFATVSHNFSFDKRIPTEVLQSALIKLQIEIK